MFVPYKGDSVVIYIIFLIFLIFLEFLMSNFEIKGLYTFFALIVYDE